MVTIINDGIIVSSDQIPENVAKKASVSKLNPLKLFSDSNGLLVAHAGVKLGYFTRDTSLASGTQAITGLGFKPTGLIMLSSGGIRTKEISWGVTDFITNKGLSSCSPEVADTFYLDNWIMLYESAGNYYFSNAVTSDADGFTITWLKVGSPTGTAELEYMAFR